MAKDTIDFLTTVVRKPAHLIGYSDGGVIALLVAVARPDLVRRMVVIGANSEPALRVTPGSEAMLDELTPDNPSMAMFRSLYEKASPDGPGHWATVIAKFVNMVRSDEPDISSADLRRISALTLVMVGDDDLPSLEHTVALYRAIPNSQLAVIPGTSHALPMEKPSLVSDLAIDFLINEPVATFMPIRRSRPPVG
jgi:pimeloyl-ACP methyl ester carboxylesterase